MNVITKRIMENIEAIDLPEVIRYGIDDEYLHYVKVVNIRIKEGFDVKNIAKKIATIIKDNVSAYNLAITLELEDSNYNEYNYVFSDKIENGMFEVNDENLSKLWEAFGDTPVDEDDNIDDDFFIWQKGTDKMYIWHWFDENHSIGLAEGLMLLED